VCVCVCVCLCLCVCACVPVCVCVLISCDEDQQLFKGIFVRHLSRMAASDSSIAAAAQQFIVRNARDVLLMPPCLLGLFSMSWGGAQDCNVTR
jgi:hypothetical protein